MNISLLLDSAVLGVALSMDAFSISLANGLNEPCMKKSRMCGVAGIFSFFQFAMPMIGWVCVSMIASHFQFFSKLIPYLALILLGFIGGKMLCEGIKGNKCDEKSAVGFGALLVQGIATSIDALSTGFTISEYNVKEALLACLIIAVVTFVLCFIGVMLGKKFGTKLADKAGILGGSILIAIGIKIFITGVFGN